MTPERRKYFMKSSNKEREIRGLIRRCKKALSISKSECNAFNLTPADKKPLEYLEKYIQLKDSKILVQALRHELARLKGMDRVTRVEKGLVTDDGDSYNEYYCENCGAMITSDKHFPKSQIASSIRCCQYCAHKFLWEKVK